MVCDLSLEQRRRGHDVAVFCLHTPGSMAPELVSLGVPVHCGHKRPGPDLRVMLQLKRLAARGTPGLVHSHSMMPNYYACAARVLGGLSTRVVNTRHDMGSTRPGDLRERLYRLSVPLTRLAVMVSQEVRMRFVSARIVPARKARVVLNGIRTAVPSNTSPHARESARRQLDLHESEFVVGCVGRLVALKNHAAAIHALARLAGGHSPGMHSRKVLALIGEGPLRADLGRLAQELGVADRVRFVGERTNVSELLPGLDAFLMPSLTEGHSIALLEAAAAGLPIVATDVGGNPEIVAPDHSGLLVPPGDPAAIAAALERLTDDPELARRLGANARAWVLANVSVEAMADAYDAIYAEALEP